MVHRSNTDHQSNGIEESKEMKFNQYIERVFGENQEFNKQLTFTIEENGSKDGLLDSLILHGKPIAGPVILAPAPSLSLVHADGELAVAKAATNKGVPFIVSTFSSYTLEEIADVSEEAVRWFQLDYPNDKNIAKSLAQRAELAGYQAIVISLDASPLAGNESILTKGYANFAVDPFFIRKVYGKSRAESYFEELTKVAFKPNVSWNDLAYIIDSVTIPIYLKGNISEEKAKTAIDYGVDGILLTNPSPSSELLGNLKMILGEDRTLIIDNLGINSSEFGNIVSLGIQLFIVSPSYLYGLVKAGKTGVESLIDEQLDIMRQHF